MNIRYDEVSYSDIMAFVDTVKYGTVSRAAKELNISQPAASKRIASLERKYGIDLFVRKGKSLQLTPAGKVFYEEMLKALDHIGTAFSRAAEVQEAPVQTLRIGYDGFFDVPLLYEMMSRLGNENENVRTEVVDNLPSMLDENCADLLDGNMDLLIVPNAWFAPIQEQVDSKRIAAFQFAILVPETHPLWEKTQVGIADLQGVPLAVAHTSHDSPYLQAIKGIFAKRGLRPNIAHFIQRERLCLNILANGFVAIATSAFFRKENSRAERFYRERIRVFPIEGEAYPVSFVWRRDDPNRSIQRFLAICDQVIGEGENRTILDRCYGA